MQFNIDIHIDIQQYLLVLLETRIFASLLEEKLIPKKTIVHLESLFCKDGFQFEFLPESVDVIPR